MSEKKIYQIELSNNKLQNQLKESNKVVDKLINSNEFDNTNKIEMDITRLFLNYEA